MILPPLYLIADPGLYKRASAIQDLDAFFGGIREAIAGGVRLIQYRDKFRARGEMFEIARRLREITSESSVCLMINDEIDLAMAIKADGVHLGQDDFPVSMARRLLGRTAVIGLSTHTLAQAREAAAQAIDYIGFGPIFPTTTKQAHDPVVGISNLAIIREQVSLPIYAIGGIQFSQLQNIMDVGASGVAVASALKGADRDTLRSWQETLDQSLKKNKKENTP